MANIPMKTLRLHGLDDTYTIPTAPEHIGAAPAGYGLGVKENEIFIFDEDELDNLRETGWYYVNAEFYLSINGSEYCCDKFGLQVESISEDYCVQTIIQDMSGDGDYSGGLHVQRILEYSGWGEWEWINPMMHEGYEYRTIERFDGNPVYTMLVKDTFQGGGSTSFAVGHNNFIRASYSVNNTSMPEPGGTTVIASADISISNGKCNVHYYCASDMAYSLNGKDCYIQIWYY